MNELMLKYSSEIASSKRTTYENITPIINFHGAVSEPVGFFMSNHIFILPSLSEGFPNVLIEAMSAGMACIVSDRLKNKLTFLKDNENVVFFECENYMDLTDKINHILTDTVLWNTLSRNAMELAKWFQTESILNEYFEVLDLPNHA
jgi:glycosyltransferase involved in cell wall biosynthesis